MARILVIDDDELIRLTVTQMLELDGHTVTTAVNGKEGLAIYDEFRPDIIITDILMPVMEGIETITEIRKLGSQVTIIAMSGGGRVQNYSLLDMAQQVGADAVLKKPFEMKALWDVVNKGLGKPEATIEAE